MRGEPPCELPEGDLCGVYPRVCGGTGNDVQLIRLDKGLSPRVRGNRSLTASSARFAVFQHAPKQPEIDACRPTLDAQQLFERTCGFRSAHEPLQFPQRRRGRFDGVPTPARRRHSARGADLQDLRRRCGAGYERKPYCLARHIRGIGFRTADLIAEKLGIEKTAMIRVHAGVSFALTEAMGEGHCGLPGSELTALAVKFLEVPDEDILAYGTANHLADVATQAGLSDWVGPTLPTGRPNAPQWTPGAPCTRSCSPSTTLNPAAAHRPPGGLPPGRFQPLSARARPGHGERCPRARLGLHGRGDPHQTAQVRLWLLAGVAGSQPTCADSLSRFGISPRSNWSYARRT